MTEISCHQRIRRWLLAKIATLPDGARIPSEQQLCDQFAVSRMTVNKVVCELAREGFVVRRRPQGTFVCKKTTAKRMTFLLPSTSYLSRSGGFQQLFLGSLNGARECGVIAETIVVSATNSQEDMNPELLSELDDRSRVIVCGPWFMPLFPILLQKKCQVLYHDNMILCSDPRWRSQTASWLKCDRDRRYAAYLLTRQMLSRGCRRIVLLSPYLDEANHPFLTGYLAAVKEAGAEALPLLQTASGAQQDNFGEGVYRFLAEKRCDAILFNGDELFGRTGEKVQTCYHLPEKIAVGLLDYDPAVNYFTSPPFYTRFDLMEIARSSVKKLLTEPFRPEREICPPILFDGEREISDPAALPPFPRNIDVSNFPKDQIWR